MTDDPRHRIAARAARELRPGEVVNLGIGIPNLIPRYLDADADIFVHTENGLLGVGPPPDEDALDEDLIDAAKRPVTALPGAAYFDSAQSFAMIRGGHVDTAVLGALQVSERGDIANWAVPGRDVLARHSPVGDVTPLADLERAEHRRVDVAAADHREALGAVEVRGAGQRGDGPLRGVDQVFVQLVPVRRRPDAEEAVLRVDEDPRVVLEEPRDQVRDPDPEVHHLARMELAGGSGRDPKTRVVRHGRSTSTST